MRLRRLVNHARCFASSKDEKVLRSWIDKHDVDWGTMEFDTLSVDAHNGGIISMRLNRPEKLNAVNMQMWEEVETFFKTVERDSGARVVVIEGEGRSFSAGMDLNVFAAMQTVAQQITCEARKRESLLRIIKRFQDAISLPEQCKVPVIASIHGLCIGGAVDFITACDIRLCDVSAEFSVKEVDLAIVADIGTLQRLPTIVGEQCARELAYTGRHMFGVR